MPYPILTLKKDKDRAVRLRHPWLFSGAVAVNPPAKSGDIVEVRNHEGKVMAFGFYQADSPIRVKLFHFGEVPGEFDDAYWFHKLAQAAKVRKGLLDTELTTGFRLIHAEGDFFPGLVVDVYGDCASVQLRSLGVERLSQTIVRYLETEWGIRHIYWKKEEKQAGKWLIGGKETIEFRENGLKFLAEVVQGQKTGFFLDQRNNRQMLRLFAKDKTVLNAFAYTGGFSVYALAGGAKSVTSVDISATAIAGCEQNIRLNSDAAKHQGVVADCFEYLKAMPQAAFDCIVLDPPAFAKNLSSVEKASRGYKEINLKAMQKIASGGLLFTFSCSQHISRELFQKIVFGAASDAHRSVRVIAHLSQGEDHPFDICHPEGEYLKGLLLWVE